MNEFTRFLFKAALAGVILALGLSWLFPGLLGPEPGQEPVSVASPAAVEDNSCSAAPFSFAPAVARATGAVVNIMTSRSTDADADAEGAFPHPHFDPGPRGTREREQASLGSGVILTADGHILTNHHVIEKADAIAVLLANGAAHPAEIIGIDIETDLAVLRIWEPGVTPAQVGRSAQLAVGDVVLAIGNPFGVGQTVTQGIVSATGRTELGINLFEDFIQTDAAINPGNSGGALINARGELIGINTAIFTRSGGSHGIGFAIPVDLAVEVMHEIIEKGYVARGWLGIEVQALNQVLAESFGLTDTRGVLIAGILNGGPAARAGLLPGDVVTHLEGQRIYTPREALNIIAHKRPGETLSIMAYREGNILELQARVDLRPV